MRHNLNATNARTIAVVRARLPYIDRRALSEAWFSALGLRERETSAAPAALSAAGREGTPLAPAAAPRASVPPVPHVAGTAPARAARSAVTKATSPGSGLAASREKKAAPLARPAAAELRYPPVHAAFRLELDGGRVHVVLRREGTVLHVVALCSERHVERVRRALGLAAEHLRLRGEALAVEVRPFAGEGAA